MIDPEDWQHVNSNPSEVSTFPSRNEHVDVIQEHQVDTESSDHNLSDVIKHQDGTQIDKQLTDKIEDLSYVVVSAKCDHHQIEYKKVDDAEMSAATNEDTGCQETSPISRSQLSNATSLSAASTSCSRRSSITGKSKESSGSFLSKLNDGNKSDLTGNATNLPASLANALSSLTSFTSSFSLGNSSTLNGSHNNNYNNASSRNSASLIIETAPTSTRLSQITESKSDVFNRKAALERKNLINLTKLIVKDLISSSLANGRSIESECSSVNHLNNYFTLIDRVLKHGLKQNLLSTRSASLWAALDNLAKYLKESTLMSESIRSLAHTKTPDGKIKAWIRLAMMQKKLPEYFNELLAQKEVLLDDIYYDYAFMLNDEAHVFAGLIIGVNVIDCNFFVKDDNFDVMDEIIDLGLYLKSVNNFEDDNNDENETTGEIDADFKSLTHEKSQQMKSLAKVLDQKNYLEEWNKHLESTISNLQLRIKALEEQNSRLEMEAKVSEVRIAKLQEQQASDTLTGAQTIGAGDLQASASKPLISSSIPDAIKSMINRNRSTASISEANNNSTQSIDQAKTTPIAVTNESVQTQQEVQKEVETATSVSDVSKVQDQKNILLEEHSTDVPQAGQPDTRLAAELERYKVKTSEQEKELKLLGERINILEISYRGALDKIRVLERDLDIQTSMNSDKETTIRIYEKDIREKQQQVESLRVSLADAKKLNSDLNTRLADTSAKLKDRLKIVTQLQESLDKWKLENKTLAGRLQDKQAAFSSLTCDLNKAMDQVKEFKRYNEKINDELRAERECGHSSSVTVEEQNIKIEQLTEKLDSVEKELNELSPYRDQYNVLKKQCKDYEQSLEEVGNQLRESKLEVEHIKENSSVYLDSQWIDSKQVKQCALCQQSFSVTRRKHHCRLCGNVFCQTCSDNKMELASSSKPVRVCDTCHAFLLAKFVKSASSSTNSSA